MELILKDKKAVIFDMDGVLVESEAIWKQAEYEVFSSLGAWVTEEHTRQTQTMTTKEVAAFWYQKFPWKETPLSEVEEMVVSRVMELISLKDCATLGISTFIKNLKERNFKIGLATNAPEKIIPVVLKKTGTESLFDSVSSADYEEKGKPHPAIYLNTAKKLKVMPEECAVIEDSETGMEAAKKAGMSVIAYTNGNNSISLQWADYQIEGF
ncbi:HAD family hydrolase [Flagellimonas lutimaris]|uniref:HAD family hydrolase n=1 Tax=Flagellimonas lutimaris TaxID=475082 RepID=A0A3A1NEZ4_9FLAO|nr:HAD-IA family hydrolase [Allomuricauda lutimaris]RIV37509.1 HAD family hydrolase [Allomuricauda lutimaris]